MKFKNFVNEVSEPGQEISFEELIQLLSPRVNGYNHKNKGKEDERIFISGNNVRDYNKVINIGLKNDFYVFTGNHGNRSIVITRDIKYPHRDGIMDNVKMVSSLVNEVSEPDQSIDIPIHEIKVKMLVYSKYEELKGFGTGNGTGEKRLLLTPHNEKDIDEIVEICNEYGYYVFLGYNGKIVITKDREYPKKSYAVDVKKTLGLADLNEANEEETETIGKFQWFIDNILSKMEIEDGEGQYQIEVKIGTSDGIRRLIINRKDFNKVADKLTKQANKNKFYIFGDDKKVAITDDKDIVNLAPYKSAKIIGKDTL